jgi:hydrogenase-4 membrane subunit HyfE
MCFERRRKSKDYVENGKLCAFVHQQYAANNDPGVAVFIVFFFLIRTVLSLFCIVSFRSFRSVIL